MIRVRTLPGGVTVATDPMPGVRSCAIGIWISVGSALEQTGEYGLTHFIEHMLFKGTRNYDALALADELNRVGGQVNASTSQESLGLHAHCVDEKAPRTIELLCEMLLDSLFDKSEIDRERNVVMEEWKMYDDNPDDSVVDLFFNNLWPGSGLGRPVIGRPRDIQRFSSAGIQRYLDREFHPTRILITLAGSFDARRCNAVINRAFKKMPRRAKPKMLGGKQKQRRVRQTTLFKPIEQVHFCFGAEAPRRGAADRFPFALLNMILGGGMSSRLFNEIREKRGLAYSVQSFTQGFRKNGAIAIAGSTSPESLDEVLQISGTEMRKLCEELVTQEELDLAREQILDSLLLSLESTSSRMMRLAEAMMVLGRPVGNKELITELQKVRPGSVRRVARKYLRGKPFAASFVAPEAMAPAKLVVPRV